MKDSASAPTLSRDCRSWDEMMRLQQISVCEHASGKSFHCSRFLLQPPSSRYPPQLTISLWLSTFHKRTPLSLLAPRRSRDSVSKSKRVTAWLQPTRELLRRFPLLRKHYTALRPYIFAGLPRGSTFHRRTRLSVPPLANRSVESQSTS